MKSGLNISDFEKFPKSEQKVWLVAVGYIIHESCDEHLLGKVSTLIGV